ncbi:hypothetical protein [Sphingomonas sp. OTU376]|uniref:hypothetical protein n=1 Tax=Sphingomonas sp. OTU376 TaxID=3043863 RepID=UPI00313E8FA1
MKLRTLRALWAALLATAVLAACGPAPRLADGCYYLGTRPVMRLAGSDGRLLVPGAVHDFRVVRAGAEIQVTPGFLFDGSGDADLHSVAWNAPQRFEIKRDAREPTLVVHRVAWGDSALKSGPAC